METNVRNRMELKKNVSSAARHVVQRAAGPSWWLRLRCLEVVVVGAPNKNDEGKKSVAPATLKKLIGQKRPEFAGYQQHDAQELLCYLLDALHEDVNRAPYPYPTEEDDEKPQSDEVKAREMWAKHKRRSDSTIVDLFQFQIRSELTCPVCSRVSVTFDPIMYLTLPVPKPPHSVDKSATIEELESALWTVLRLG
eukprot:Skav206652  [mRNA]  locus=scaffold1933:147896:166509:+ [translate_table: standard]